jgi:hypothetical protein
MTLICGTCNIERASRTCALLTKEREAVSMNSIKFLMFLQESIVELLKAISYIYQ